MVALVELVVSVLAELLVPVLVSVLVLMPGGGVEASAPL